MSTPRLTPETEQALRAAREMALQASHDEVMPLHLANVLMRDHQRMPHLRRAIVQVSGGAKADSFYQVLSASLQKKNEQKGKRKNKRTRSTMTGSGDSPRYSASLVDAIKHARSAQERRSFGTPLELEQLVLSLHYGKSSPQISKYYKEAGVDMEQVREELKKHVGDGGANSTVLDMYGHDLVAEAWDGKLKNAAISRCDEIHSVANILSGRNKNNAILIGEPGVGKTAIVQGLAVHIAKGHSRSLKGARLIALNMARLVDDNECEKRLRQVLEEVEKAQGKVILYIKNIHSTMDGSVNATNNLIGPLLLGLGTGHLQCIGSTTPENYLKYFDRDAAFNRHFEKVEVGELSVKDTIAILRLRKANFEFDYDVRIDDDALETAARLASRYITAGRRLPDKAIAVVDKACTRVSRQLESRPLKMDTLEDDMRKLKTKLRSMGKDKARKARRDEVKKHLLDLSKELTTKKTEYNKKKKRVREYMKWCHYDESDVKDAQLSPSMLKNLNPMETAIALVQPELRAINKELREINKREKEWTNLMERGLKEKVNENEARWKKFLVDMDDDLRSMHERKQELHATKQEWKKYIRESRESTHESTKLFEVVMRDRTVDKEKIEFEVSWEAKIPVKKLGREEKLRLSGLAAALQKRVFGQTKAVEAVVKAIKASKRRDKQQKRPIGSFLFLGPTGVGKTELAKALAEELFDDEKQFIRFDMSEYGEEHSVAGLIGAPPGYEGYDVGGALTNAVWSKPYSVVLFDEIDKAHKAVLNILLQVLDDGILTDRKGKKVDFTDTVIIMTSNLIENHDGTNSMNEDNIHRKLLNVHLSPELRGRISKIVNFVRLSKQHLREIAKHHIKLLEGCFDDLGLTLDVTPAAVEFILGLPDVKTYGARKLRTWIETEMMAELVEMEIDDKIVKNCTVHVSCVKDAGEKKLVYVPVDAKTGEKSNMNEGVSNEDSTDEDYGFTSDDDDSSTDEECDISDEPIPKEDTDKDTRKNKRKWEDDQPEWKWEDDQPEYTFFDRTCEYTYNEGLPFGNEAYVNSLPKECQILHEWYMTRTNERKDLPQSITAKFINNEVHDSGPRYIAIKFDDLHLLYQYKELDAQLLRVWTLYMIEEARCLVPQRLEFLDPELISQKAAEDDMQRVVDYISEVLINSEGKDYIVGAYYSKSNWHWIAVVIDLTTASVIYMDSRNYSPFFYKPIRTAIDRAWEIFVQAPTYKPPTRRLYHHFDFPCNIQPQGNKQCGFYTCWYMQQLVSTMPEHILDDKRRLPQWNIPTSALQEEDLQSIRGKLCNFINQQILDKDGKYYLAEAHTTAMDQPVNGGAAETEGSTQADEDQAREAAVRSFTTDIEDDGLGAGSSPREDSRPKRARKPNPKVTRPN